MAGDDIGLQASCLFYYRICQCYALCNEGGERVKRKSDDSKSEESKSEESKSEESKSEESTGVLICYDISIFLFLQLLIYIIVTISCGGFAWKKCVH